MTNNKFSHLHYGWIVLAMGTFVVFGALGLARFGYTTVLPSMQGDIGMDNSQAGLLATINLAGYLTLSLIGGALASRFGVRVVASSGLVLAGAGMIFTGLVNGFLAVAVLRGLTGIGSGAANVAVMGLWPAWFSRSKRGLASGIAVSGSSIALILTGLFVPWIINTVGGSAWRTCWFIYGGITLLLAVGSGLILRNKPVVMGLKPVGEEQNPAPVYPQRSRTFNWKSVYLSASIWYLGLVYIAFGFSYIIYMTFFVKYLVGGCGYTTASAGRLFMLMGWFSLLCGLVWGMVSDRIGRRNTLIIIFLIHTAAFSLFAIGNSPVYFVFSAILFGLTAWSIPAIMAATCGDLLGPELAPAALGFVTLFLGIGQAAGPVVAGVIADSTGTFSPVFLLASAIALLGALGSVFMSRNREAR